MTQTLSQSQPLEKTSSPQGVDALPFTRFVWGAGVECSFLPHITVDQFAWTQHHRHWKEDLRCAADLGLTHLRYSFPWNELEPKRGDYNWSMADERLAEMDKLGLEPLLDVTHFGTPLWLKQAVGDPEFPEALESFAFAMVSRYAGQVRTWCPFNEPLVSALFSGDFGFWPPHQRKWRGYMPVLSRIVQATARATRAIRRARPDAIVLLCDAAESYKTRHAPLRDEVARRNLRRFLVMDLLLGKVDRHHPLHEWLSSYGLSELDLQWFIQNSQAPDVLGLDYYAHSDWQLEMIGGSVRQRRAENPAGFFGIAQAYWQRYGIPLMLTETSIEGQPINREIWLETNLDHIQRLRRQGVPVLGFIWWPLMDQVDWDGALTHRVGKVHQVGLWALQRQANGDLLRKPTPLIEQYKLAIEQNEQRIGALEFISQPSLEAEQEQLPPIGQWIQPRTASADARQAENRNRPDPAPGLAGEPAVSDAFEQRLEKAIDQPALQSKPATNGHAPAAALAENTGNDSPADPETGRYGIVVFSHLRWGFVWQRPQQFLSRFAKKHPILFIEEPFFDLPEGAEPRIDFHMVMPNVTVVTPHCAGSWNRNPKLPEKLRQWAREAIDRMNEDSDGIFDRPLLWYYSPMDSAWSLGHFANRGVVYDCMDELSQFSGAPRQLVENEARLIRHADVLFTGGYNLGEKKKRQHGNVHTFGCGVEYSHFSKARDPSTSIPPDIDFMHRPILGWFGVVDERVDYAMLGEIARQRPDWSLAIVGPVVKVDPNLLPHSPNLFWMGGRDYQQLPNYCAAFDVCMMPFAINAATEFINPTKGLEYMATGRPIVSTPVKDVVDQWSDIVHVVKDTRQFIKTVDQILRNPPRQRIERGIELAKQCSWEGTVARMQELIAQAIGRDDRPSRKPIEPLTESELEYQYAYTPGS